MPRNHHHDSLGVPAAGAGAARPRPGATRDLQRPGTRKVLFMVPRKMQCFSMFLCCSVAYMFTDFSRGDTPTVSRTLSNDKYLGRPMPPNVCQRSSWFNRCRFQSLSLHTYYASLPLSLRGGQNSGEEDSAFTDSVIAAVSSMNGTKSSCKAARKEAERIAKARPCPEGASLLAAGDEAYRASRWGDARSLFTAATAKFRVAAKAPTRTPTGPPSTRPQNHSAASAPTSVRLFLSDPASNLQAKPLRAGVPPERNYARNSPEVLAAFLAKFGRGYRTRFPPEPNG